MGIIKDKLKCQVQSENRTKYNDTVATILEYDITTNTADIKFPNPNGEGNLYRRSVKISNSLGGLAGSGIYAGGQCFISFIGNNMYAPIITGIIDNNYTAKTNTDQGASLVDSSVLYQEEPEEIIPMSSDWIDETNTSNTKYVTEFKDYTDSDVTRTVHECINSVDKYKTTDQGITNLSTNSTTKLKENGDIDIFISNNTGIRISNTDHKIYFYGLGFVFNGVEITSDMLSQMIENIGTSANSVSVSDVISIIESHNKIKDIDADLEELKLVISLLKQITGNSSKYAIIESKITSFEKLREKYYSSTSFTSQEYDDMYNTLVEYKEYFEQELAEGEVIIQNQ